MVHRIRLERSFSETVKHGLELEKDPALTTIQVAAKLGLTLSMYSRSKRIYLTAQGSNATAENVKIRNYAASLVVALNTGTISISSADERLNRMIQLEAPGTKKRPKQYGVSISDPGKQLETYRRATASLEGICYGLDKLPDNVHPYISQDDREAMLERLVKCRTILERRINIFRKDNSAEAT